LVKLFGLTVLLVALSAFAGLAGDAAAEEDGRVPAAAPVDYGFGAGVHPDSYGRKLKNLLRSTPAPFVGGPDAASKGAFGTPITWPILAVHAVLLPDGRVLSYGPAYAEPFKPQLVYDIWDPALGTETASHFVMPNTTGTELFCNAQSVMGRTGEVLLSGGDQTINGKINFSHNRTAVFSPVTNTIRSAAPMTYKRWYPTLVGLPSGSMLVLGGRENQAPDNPTTVPEIYTPSIGWRALTGAASDAAFGAAGKNWYYPRGFLAPNGKVFVLAHTGSMFYLDPAGLGTLTRLAPTTTAASGSLPTLMYAPGKILAVRNQQRVTLVDLNPATPKVTATASLTEGRLLANATVLADGKVVVNGGSTNWNQLQGASYRVEIWNPATGRWTIGAQADKPRLYHSTSLLLGDGTVLTVGGGQPGPVFNLNGEIYYPPYLFAADNSGKLATRPSLAGLPSTVRLGKVVAATVGATDRIARVTLVRTGSATHAFNADQRFRELAFVQSGASLSITVPSSAKLVPAGYYMIFAFNQAGVPSAARIVHITA
jgi:hypothetical protein